jgi:hypothetical protein
MAPKWSVGEGFARTFLREGSSGRTTEHLEDHPATGKVAEGAGKTNEPLRCPDGPILHIERWARATNR